MDKFSKRRNCFFNGPDVLAFPDFSDFKRSDQCLFVAAQIICELASTAHLIQIDYHPNAHRKNCLLPHPLQRLLAHTPLAENDFPTSYFAPTLALRKDQGRTGDLWIYSSHAKLVPCLPPDAEALREADELRSGILKAVWMTERIIDVKWLEILDLQKRLTDHFIGARSSSYMYWARDGEVRWASYQEWVEAQEGDGTLPPDLRYD